MKIIIDQITIKELKEMSKEKLFENLINTLTKVIYKKAREQVRYHKKLAAGKWFKLSFFEQMANTGSEVERAMKWREKNMEYSRFASDRALELLDLTISDAKNRRRLKELFRLREVLADYFYFDNIYKSDDKVWHNYFQAFNYAAVIQAR